jgi:glycosyltransferase involved in cell wall biosynthesis
MAYEVTIGIPVYHVEKHIRQTIESVLAQTFESIEILVVDDCGTDHSIAIVEELQQTHPRGGCIRILHQPHNMGIGAGRNRMMDEAQGRYFYSLDSDDIITPDAIALLYETAQKHDAQIVYGSYDRIYLNDEGERVETCAYPLKTFSEPDEYADYVYHEGIQVMNWNYLIRMDVIRNNHLRVAEVGHGYGEDFTFTVDLPTYITRAVLLPNVTYHYFIRGIDKHKRKKLLTRANMNLAIQALEEKKRRDELKGKSYYAKRISVLMMYECSFACEMLARRKDFDVPFSDREIHSILWHPMSLSSILLSPSGRKQNLTYWFLGTMPSFMTAWLLKLMMKRYGTAVY